MGKINRSSFKLIAICYCCLLFVSCGSEKENMQDATTVTVEQNTITETTVPDFEYDPQNDTIPSIPIHPDYDTRVIIKNYLDQPKCTAKMYERLIEIYTAIDALDISKSEQHYEYVQGEGVEPMLRTSVGTGAGEHWLYFSKVQSGSFVFRWQYFSKSQDNWIYVCNVKVEDEHICQLITEFMQDVDEWYWSGEPEGWWESH